MLAIVFCSIIGNFTRQGDKTVTAVSAESGTASVLNLNGQGISKNNFSDILQGGQNEYIYFGENPYSTIKNMPGYQNTHTGAVKWRVLTSDSKYSRGYILLWSDYSLGIGNHYNSNAQNPYYAFWGTSMMRAKFNGGMYLSTVSNSTDVPKLDQTVADVDSWLYKMFVESERESIVCANNNITKAFGYVETNSLPKSNTTNIIGVGNGKYDPNIINNSDAGKYAEIGDNNSVIETTDDMLFLLDYYDINNTDYGFGDKDSYGNIKTFANKTNPSWSFEDDGYPVVYDVSVQSSTYVNYLKEGYHFWLRTPGRYSTSVSYSLYVNKDGCIAHADVNGNLCAVKPAFNFSPNSVVYATAATVPSGSTFASVSTVNGTKPAYKVYIKSNNYVNYNENKTDAPKIYTSGGKVTVKKPGQKGSAIILLSDKSDNGTVLYQATANFNNGVAVVNVPSNIDVYDYNITALFVDSIRGDVYSETVMGSYTSLGLALPEDLSVTYNGTLRSLMDIKNADWYDSSVYEYASRMDISIPSNAIHNGSYAVNFSIKDTNLKWEDGTRSDKELILTIAPKSVGLVWLEDENGVYSALPASEDVCEADSDIISDIVKTRYKSRNETSEYDDYSPPKKIGDYSAFAEINNLDYLIKDNEQKSKNFTLSALKIPMLLASNFSPSNMQPYTGKDRTFEIINYDYKWKGSAGDSSVEISIPARYAGKITIDQDNYIIVKEAGTYALQLELTDTENSRWADKSETAADRTAPREVEFKIAKKSLNGEIVSGIDEDGIIQAVVGNDVKVMFEMAELPFAGDDISIDIYAYKSGSSNSTLLKGNIIVSQTDGEYSYQVDLNTSALRIAGQYTLKFELRDNINTANGNYELLIEDVELALTEEVDEGSITWRLKEGNILIDSTRTPIGEFSMSYAPANTIKYNKNKTYKFEVRTPSGYVVDTATEEGFVNGYKTIDLDGNIIEKCKDASKYTTQVRIKNTLTQEVQIYEIKWEITKAKYDLSQVKWKGNGRLEYNGLLQDMVLENLPEGLEILSYVGDEQYRDVTTSALHIAVEDLGFTDEAYEKNYILPIVGDDATYIGSVVWETDWSIVPKEIKVQWGKELLKDKDGNSFNIAILRSKGENTVVVHTYYKSDGKGNKVGEAISESDIVVPETGIAYYICELTLSSNDGYILTGTTTREFAVSNQGSAVKFTPNKLTFAYTGKEIKLWFSNDGNLKSSQYKVTYYSAGGASPLTSAPTSVGKYRVEITLNDELNGKYFIGGDSEWEFEIVARIINESWNTTSKPPRLNINKTELGMIDYEFMDEEGNVVSYDQMKSKAGVYSVKAKIKGAYVGNCSFASGGNETEWIDFELTEDDLANMQDPNDPTLYPDDPDMQEPEEPDDNNPSGDIGSGNEPGGDGGALDELLKKLKDMPLWQLIASFVSIILIIIFMSKGFGYASKAKQSKKLAQSKFKEYYAGTFLGLAFGGWTAIACVLMGLAVLSLVFMILEKNRYNKAIFAYEEAKDDFERHRETNRREYDDNRREEEYRRREEDDRRRDEEYRRRDEEYRQREEDMKAMFMRMMGGYDFNNMGQPQGAYAGMQQGIGAEEIRGIVSETVTALLPGMQQALPQQASVNDEMVKSLIEEQKAMREMIKQLADKSTEKIIEKEVVATISNDETIKQMLRNQEKLMEKILELSANQPQQIIAAQPQVIEKIVEKPVEKIVEVPVETVVEKVVEKPIVISTEAEKSKQVKTPAPKKAPAPRLTLEEAYAQLTKEQKKYFDGLREYAMSKDSKCKEKLSTYFTTIGPSTTNPFIKLTIKKGITVALFKMEDEYLKDIRRNASGDGTKVKVKETEVPIGDKQAYDTAKDMVDLRIDQIDRYNDFLKEQRALRKS
jgi:hypothetical protein